MAKTDVKFGICDRVVFFNTATCNVSDGIVKGIQVVPTGISKDADGNDVLDGYEVLYQLRDGGVVTQAEAFASADECLEHYRKVFCPEL